MGQLLGQCPTQHLGMRITFHALVLLDHFDMGHAHAPGKKIPLQRQVNHC